MGASVVDRLRQPEYTGENRCIPCTIVNTVIAIGLAVVVGAALSTTGATPTGAAAAAAVVLGVSLAAIYLRGYLVPYTPQLTKQYFPDRVLAWFDKEPAGAGGLADAEVADAATDDAQRAAAGTDDAVADDADDAPVAGTEAELDPEPILLEAGAIEVCMDGEDLCPTEEFTAAWREEVRSLRENGNLERRIAEVVDADPDAVEVVERDSFALVRADGQAVARWESYPALLADMAAFPLLADRVDGWDEFTRQVRGSLLNGARVFLESCPDCDGEVAFSRDTVESCCRSVDVIAMECSNCEARLLEVEAA